MEDSKDKVQENLLANGGRCCEWGYLHALMLLIIASGCEHLELKHSHIRKDNNQEYFLRTLSGQIPFFFYFSKLREALSSSSFASCFRDSIKQLVPLCGINVSSTRTKE